MKFPHFFIQRPIFAIVLSVFMLIAGALAFFQLPLSEYPSVTPPTVQVSASYPGANPKVIADTVAAPLEQAINGVEGHVVHEFPDVCRRSNGIDDFIPAGNRPRYCADSGAEPGFSGLAALAA